MMEISFNCFGHQRAHVKHTLPKLSKKGIAMSKDEPGVSSYRESISSKLGQLKQIMLDVEDVPALKTMELELGKLYESMKGHEQKRVAMEPETRSHKRGLSFSRDTRPCKPKIVEDLYCVNYPTICLPNLSTSLEVACDASVGPFL